ncbi:ATP-binding protein [Pseudodesulfovibrio sp. zrk46]|uniref:AlbA family DNA-binding domain-containing protein n=1 Tax=Pseudodesulfovibrio sp. zrk46 TaxID=2725288 RepID=UPI0014499B16|nr:ATP-binding protein [Pseudodesulfovibrio sp. zrk46]QJB54933.1 ATP-binding protein [Pseudodesulfovibrio sp. zrk46]
MAGRKLIKGKKLYKILFIGVIFTVLAVGSLAILGVRAVRHDAAVVAVESSARGVVGAVTVLINALTANNAEIGSKSLISMKPSVLRATLSRMIKGHDQLASIIISDASGLRYMLSRRSDGMMEVVPDKTNTSVFEWTYVRPDGMEYKSGAEYILSRFVVGRALANEFIHLRPGQVNWRSADMFQAPGGAWLAASTLIQADGKNYMISYVFPVDAVLSHLGSAEKGNAEKVFLYWKNGKVLAVAPTLEAGGVESALSEAMAVDKLTDPVLVAASDKLASSKAARRAPFSYSVDGEVWWSYVMPLSVFGDTLSLGVAVPRKNIVSALTSDRFLQMFGGALVLFASAVLFVLYRNRARIEAIGVGQKKPRTASDILALIEEGESRTLEFKQTMRFNLKSGKNGREIEHAAMKTVAGFLNSDGGTLLVGVADNGDITGFDEDKFESEDKAMLHFNNLVNSHIGTEFSRYLDTKIVEIEGKHVLRAYCLPASAPAILDNGKSEEFYVRSGPASRQLSLSQFYEWLQNH